MFIDSHAHLDMSRFDEDRDEVIKRSLREGISIILNAGSSVKGSIASVELSRKYDFIYASVGIHPHEVKEADELSYSTIEKLAQQKKVLAIGEIGLDYFKNYSPKEDQKNVFIHQLQIAKDLNKPVIIHCRDANDDTVRILRQVNWHNRRGIIHCFSGDEAMLKDVLDLGFYISFAGPVTFPKSLNLQKIAKLVPTDRLLIETDSPYLSPQPKRGKRCEPLYVKYTAEKIASLRGVGIEDIARLTANNFLTLFGLNETGKTETLSYKIRNSLYLNITNKCSNECTFCAKFSSFYVQGHYLKLPYEPASEEIIDAVGNPKDYDEIVFCGFGESTMRFDILKEVARWIKKHGGKVRLNTNGHGNVYNKRNIAKELEGLVDVVSVSLNAENADKYNELCKQCFPECTYESVKDFILEAKKYIPEVVATVLDMPDVIDIEKCRKIAAEDLKVGFRIRRYNMVGA